MEQFDIVVVGGGPAGATFARIAGENRKILLAGSKRAVPSLAAACSPQTPKRHWPGLKSHCPRKSWWTRKSSPSKPSTWPPGRSAITSGCTSIWIGRNLTSGFGPFCPQGWNRVCGRCCSIRRQGGGFLVGYSAGGSLHTVFAKQLVGADGAGSVVRSQCFGPLKTRAVCGHPAVVFGQGCGNPSFLFLYL